MTHTHTHVRDSCKHQFVAVAMDSIFYFIFYLFIFPQDSLLTCNMIGTSTLVPRELLPSVRMSLSIRVTSTELTHLHRANMVIRGTLTKTMVKTGKPQPTL